MPSEGPYKAQFVDENAEFLISLSEQCVLSPAETIQQALRFLRWVNEERTLGSRLLMHYPEQLSEVDFSGIILRPQ
jgi:hypothetical protein